MDEVIELPDGVDLFDFALTHSAKEDRRRAQAPRRLSEQLRTVSVGPNTLRKLDGDWTAEQIAAGEAGPVEEPDDCWQQVGQAYDDVRQVVARHDSAFDRYEWAQEWLGNEMESDTPDGGRQRRAREAVDHAVAELRSIESEFRERLALADSLYDAAMEVDPR